MAKKEAEKVEAAVGEESKHQVKVGVCDYIRAGYPYIWIQTHEEDRAINITKECLVEEEKNDRPGESYEWDVSRGIISHRKDKAGDDKATDPVAFLEAVEKKIAGREDANITFFAKDFHRFSSSNIVIIRKMKNLVAMLKESGSRIILVGPVTNIPTELEKDIVPCSFDLPEIAEILKVAETIMNASGLDGAECKNSHLEAARGLTIMEAENAIALSLATTGKITKELIEVEKLNAVKKSGLLEQFPVVEESQLGGLLPLKNYIHARKRGFTESGLPRPKGIILTGLPGAGKSLSAKVIANTLEYPLLRLDISALKGSLVGESEKKMREALALIDAISPVVVWIDEIEKALGGVQSSNRTDGGTTSAMFGYLLTWMQESKTPKYIVATCNDIDDLLQISQGALMRRFDDVFFLDVPSEKERVEILKIMNARYGQNIDLNITKRMDNWTGAEIEKFVVASVYEGIDIAFNMTKPIYLKNKERVDQARGWAAQNARIANELDPEKDPNSSLKDLVGRKVNTKKTTSASNEI